VRPAGAEPVSHRGGLKGLLIGRPRLALGAWLFAAVLLAFAGRNLADHLRPHPPLIDGSQAKLAHEITLRQFGSDESIVISLRGPAAEVERQGRRLGAGIDAQPKTLVVSPWSPGGAAIGGLRPEPGVAGIVVRVEHHGDEGITEHIEMVEDQIDKAVEPPVHASIAGLARLFSSYTEANEEATKTAELIAFPALLLILLLVFRSVVAALIPIVAGGFVVASSNGVLRLLVGVVQVESFALAAAGMIGLALGVDYSLLVVSRFREERRRSDPSTAMRTTVEAAARSILPAAGGLCLAMLIAAQILPGAFISSAALAIVIAATLSAVSALTAVPAGIMLLGDNLERWSLPRRFSVRGTPLLLSNRIVRSPRAVGMTVLALLFLAVWAATLKTGLGSPEQLPPGDRGRVEEEQVRKALGPGWLAPIEVVFRERGEPMTSPRRLRSLVAFQKRLEGEPGVQEVTGFSVIERGLRPLSRFESRLARQENGARRLGSGIARADSGARRNSEGIHTAASGASELGRGVEATTYGADLLAEGLTRSHAGSDLLTQGLAQTSEGTDELAEGSSTTSEGTDRLVEALERAQKEVRDSQGNVRSTKSAMRSGSARLAEAEAPLSNAEARLAAAWQALQQMTTGTADPQYAALQRAVREARESLSGKSVDDEEESGTSNSGVAGAIARAQRQFDLGLYLAGKLGEANADAADSTAKLAKSSRQLDRGVQRLADGFTEMASALAELSAQGQQLSPALRRLQAGTENLVAGLVRLGGGATGLASGLGDGAQGAERLTVALHGLNRRLGADSEDQSSSLDRLRERSPELFRSGYFFLAGLDGSEAERREAANFMIDISRGGHTARMMVIPRNPVTTSEGRQAFDRVRADTEDFARSTGTDATVGGFAASQRVIDETLRDRTAIARLAMMIITALVLIPVLRSLIVPIIAAFLNLLTVSASLGIVSLLFNGSLLGGPGFVDSTIVPVTIMVIFGLAIDYEVFIFARMREEYVRTGSPDAAVDNGIARTTPVVTGAAVIMIVVFLCFGISDFPTMRNFGVAQATAVFIDAFVVRLIVVPALMKRLGRWSWWMPGWMDRALPGGQRPLSRESAPA
jgi:putative drug exporter of the RND superfamily